MCNVTAWRHSKLRAHWQMALVGGGGGGLQREKYVFCVPRELQRLLSLFSLWEESVGGAYKGGENSLHWKANMLPLFIIFLTLWLLQYFKEKDFSYSGALL